ncbi:MAG: S41 family peptidase [Xanthomonadales bacterium]|nr:S41 family peptidase [Xanthomonadales bacterium]
MPGRFLSCLLLIGTAAGAAPGYFQHPTHQGEQLAFAAEGDLWIANLAGGIAQRLTSHEEIETRPVFSPDGNRIAYLSAFDRQGDLYVMPTSGGLPKQVTFDGSVVSVEGWTDDGRIIYVTDEARGPTRTTLVRTVDPDDLSVTEWPLAGANQGAVGPDGRLYFTRRGLHRTGDHSKHYRGGAMARLWYFDAGTEEALRLLPDFEANLKRPMFTGGRIYFLADPDGDFNIWSTDPQGEDLRQHTRHVDWDVRNPEARDGSIVYQLGADLYRLDLADDSTARIELTLRSDFDDQRKRWLPKPLDYATSINLAPEGDRVVVTARGRVASVGLPDERRVVIPIPGEQRARAAITGVDGEWIYAIVADDRFDEIVRFPADGSGQREVLTDDGSIHRWRLSPSPDGRWLAHSDKRGDLWLLDLEKGANRRIDRSPPGDDAYADLTWSADGQLLAYVRSSDQTRLAQVVIHDTRNGHREVLTTDRFPSFAPAFSSDRAWLYFLSDRHFEATPSAPWGDRNMGPMFDRRTQVYALALDPEARFPYLPSGLGAPEEAVDEEKDDEEMDDDAPAPLVLDGLQDRLYEVDVDPGNYSRLQAADEHLFLLDAPLHGDPVLKSIEIDPKAKVETFASKVADYALSADRKKLYFRVDNDAYIVDVAPKAPEDLGPAKLNFDAWKLAISPAEEWQQMFEDAWRMHRDFAFDRNLRGVDWNAVKAKYEPLVARVTHRAELDDLLGEMISELGILHSQVGRAELESDDEKPAQGALGGEYESVADGLKITHILRGDPDLPEERVPLARPEADVRIGDVLVSVNYRPVRNHAELAAALENQVGQPVVLEVRRGKALHEARVEPFDAGELHRRRYRDWEQANRRRVEEATAGQVGYLHLYAMGGSDIADFAREFYALYRRDGLVIDVRRNRGGNVDSWVINTLMRKVWAFWQTADESESGFENMQQAFRGHLAVLIDEYTYSDGETFAAGVKALDLAPLIGQRTAGAGIWLSDRNTLADNGIARIAEFAQYATNGDWLIEGHGVSPDIEVENPPHAAYLGTDHQLERAIQYLQQRIEAEPVPVLRGKPIPEVGTPGEDVEG